MAIVPWPVVSRADVVRAFKPGTDATREGPLRTLRSHHWVSKGVNLQSRSRSHAAGSLTLFSWLNLDAARAARRGDKKAAVQIAREAARLEMSAQFRAFAKLLSSLSAHSAKAVVRGVLPESAPRALEELLRSTAHATANRRRRLSADEHVEAVFGKVTRVDSDFVELLDAHGSRVRYSKALAEAAQRDQPGDYLAVFFDHLGDAQAILSAAPALDTRAEIPRRAFSPFERSDAPRPLQAEDVALLSRPPKPIKLRLPITIDE